MSRIARTYLLGRIFAFAVLLITATAVTAEDYEIDSHQIDRCLAINDHTPMACVGRQAEVCFGSINGGSQAVLTECYRGEMRFWDTALNAVYQELLALVGALEDGDDRYTAPELTAATRDMQRAWIDYRDATCALAMTRAGPDALSASTAQNYCTLQETARQYFQLQTIAGRFRP